jgi:regulator of ribosome biosynthesis
LVVPSAQRDADDDDDDDDDDDGGGKTKIDMDVDASTGRIKITAALDAVDAHEGPLDIDAGHLLVSDAAPLDFTYTAPDREELASMRARGVLQRLIAELFALPSETDVSGRFAQLPEGETTFPRLRALPPSEKPLTKWEQFAKDKGIKKRKRTKHVFDEQSDEWKRRHGYQRAKDANEVIIMPGKWSEVAGKTEDPFTREEREKRERVGKNQEKQNKNLLNAVATHGVKALPPTLRLSVTGKKGAVGAGKLGKREMKDVAAQVAYSTASVGKFNAPVAGDDKIKMRGKRRQFSSVTEVDTERKKSADVVQKLLRKEKERGAGFDVNAAARHIQQEKEKANRKRKSSSAKSDGGDASGKTPGKGGKAGGKRAKK